ncbi:uncharacterized protein LOC119599801 [Lucilia sericata]|uniref:uncharacterized protein LOC119599801 n=1 Tax=Lucilia sericata TaxID=13632 RepID=UPI0018A87D85|nr:uncharacterized protein LOC119599801 [Lucilia sericata]
METISPYVEDFREIKICRLCGSNSNENVDIFTSKPISSRSDDLLTKILTVYPLVLYKNDPLPQHICPKCIGNVSTTYQDIQQVLRQQNKWMNLTKAVQPEHKYFRILDMVENSSKTTKESIKTSYNIDINNLPLTKIIISPSKEIPIPNAINTSNKININENVVKNIQTKLESNGFTIKRIKVPTTTTEVKQDLNTTGVSIDLTENSVETGANIVTCNYCKQKFSNMKILAQHQLIHLKVSVNKVFQKHLLPKQSRRGRLITINDNKCIRCLNCWRIFKDNKDILQHWSGGECEFYCLVCGKEFPHSPKMLREHVTTVHDISYRSVARGYMACQTAPIKPMEFPVPTFKYANMYPMTTKLKSRTYKKPPPKSCTKNDDGTITCKICYKVFDNFRSSNSHMRKHKPPIRYGEPIITQAIPMDNYNTRDEYMTQPSTSHFRYVNSNPSSSATTNVLHMKFPRPAYRVIMKNGPLRGIKTKIVQKRHDFLTNYPHNDPPSTQRSMTSTSDPSEDENMIVPEVLMPAFKSEHITDNYNHNKNLDGLQYNDYTNSRLGPTIKSEPLDNSEYAETQEPRQCFICNENFSNTREYELHAMFVHNIN